MISDRRTSTHLRGIGTAVARREHAASPECIADLQFHRRLETWTTLAAARRLPATFSWLRARSVLSGVLMFVTHNPTVSWAFGLSLMVWCVVMIVWLLKNDHETV